MNILRFFSPKRIVQEVLDAPDKEFIFTFRVANTNVDIVATNASEALVTLVTSDFSAKARVEAFLVSVRDVE